MNVSLSFRQKFTKALLIGAFGFVTISMNGCDAIYWNEQESLSRVQSRSEIVILTTEDALIYNKTTGGEVFGIDHDLLENFAQTYHLKTKFVVLPDEQSVIRALSNGEGDIAAARLRSASYNTGFLVGPAYEDTFLSLYCHKKAQVQNIKDLNHKNIGILKKDIYPGFSQRLNQLAPEINIEEMENTTIQDLFASAINKKNNCIIAENFSGDFYNRYYSQLEKVTQLTDHYSVSWLLTPNNQDLLQLVQAWYQKASRNDQINEILIRYKVHYEKLSHSDIATLFKKIRTTLPLYKDIFKQASEEYDLPWQLIAAVAYQESHWQPEATSFTGVKGLMQLTEETANHIGVDDRTDPEQSILGGAKYLRYLLDKQPANLNSKDRLALALAAYNIGFAHLKDAQRLAQRKGRNPVSWHQLREIFPLLEDPSNSAELQYGTARGNETVNFVERVKSFYNLMISKG